MKNKKIILGICIILVIVIILLKIFAFYDKYKMPKKCNIESKNVTYEVYKEADNWEDLIIKSNVEILTENEKLDVTEVGEHTYTIEYKGTLGRKFLYDINYTVEDTVSPIFISGLITEKNIEVGEKYSIEDLTKKLTYGDNYDKAPILSVDGEIDCDIVGTYEIDLTLTDSSKNITTKTVKVNVIEPVEKEENTDEETEDEEDDGKVKIADQIENYKKSNTMIGIDISKWQGEVDFEKVKNAGVEFVIIRMAVMKDKDSDLVIDKTFETNYKNAKAAGLKVGVYVYSEANTVEKAISNAELIIDTLSGDKLDFPVAFDWESWTYFNDMDMNLQMLNDMYDAFESKLSENGYEAMLYGSQTYLNKAWLDLKDYTLWVARYSEKNPEINSENDILIWQNSNTGVVDGISGDVDLDIYYK